MALNEKGRTTERVIIRQFFSKILAWVIFSCLFIYRNGTKKTQLTFSCMTGTGLKNTPVLPLCLGELAQKTIENMHFFMIGMVLARKW